MYEYKQLLKSEYELLIFFNLLPTMFAYYTIHRTRIIINLQIPIIPMK